MRWTRITVRIWGDSECLNHFNKLIHRLYNIVLSFLTLPVNILSICYLELLQGLYNTKLGTVSTLSFVSQSLDRCAAIMLFNGTDIYTVYIQRLACNSMFAYARVPRQTYDMVLRTPHYLLAMTLHWSDAVDASPSNRKGNWKSMRDDDSDEAAYSPRLTNHKAYVTAIWRDKNRVLTLDLISLRGHHLVDDILPYCRTPANPELINHTQVS